MTTPRPRVLFVCVKNGGKSQMAAGLMRAAAGDRVEVFSAGTAPGGSLNAQSVEALLEVGVDIRAERPQPIDPTLLAGVDVVVTLGGEAHVEPVPGPRFETWETDEPSARGIEGMERMRLVRDDIARRVEALATALTEPAGTADDALPDSARTAFLDQMVSLLAAVNAHEQRRLSKDGPTVAEALTEHLGTDPRRVSVLTEAISAFRVVDADVAVEVVVARAGGGRLIGVGGGEQRRHASLSEIIESSVMWRQYPVGAVDFERSPVGPDAERRVVAFGLHLFHHGGHPVALLERSASPMNGQEARLEVVAAHEGTASAVLAEIRETMISHSVLRGQVLSFTVSPYTASTGGVSFLRRTAVAAQDVVLPPGTLERVERQVLGVAKHRERLLAAGQHLKRGVLLYGPPGTGKTHTVQHLLGADPSTTVIVLAGQALSLVRLATETAHALQPAIVVLEDCDLIAEDRSFHAGPQPLLFEVLDAMDGLGRDADVAFILTTNRADLLERALAQRPGRVDLAVEIPLPDDDARRRLFRLYAGSLPFSAPALEHAAERTGGVTASFVKEVIRRAVLLAAEGDRDVDDAALDEAVAELSADGQQITRSLLGSGEQPADRSAPGVGDEPSMPSMGWVP